jgi:RNA polymerase sigma-70 factor (ECF subfamily)
MQRWAPPEIVSSALSGDGQAAERLIAAVWPGCFRLAATVLGDRDLAQDAAQEACAIVYRKVRSLRDPAAFDAWLYRIVMREAIRIRRRHPFASPAKDGASPAIDSAATIDVWRALRVLSAEQRDVVILFYFDDLRSEEIAAILRIPHATVRTRLARARERLRGILDGYRTAPTTHLEVKQHAL